ncbi:hypothetical protein [uncultured Microbulbifer sp.]|uniref:hypothetical protein n=1 Tax=uncultured Microbulbifer sp. TaxID=348147 RepID=UPI002629ACB7|nr:hypothetical protein [uncultured Microbulbifer sp.]
MKKEKLIRFQCCEKNFHLCWNGSECNLAGNALNSDISRPQTGGGFILNSSLAAILTARLLHSIGRYVCRKDFYKAHQTGDVLLSMLLTNINGKELGDEFHSSQVLNRNYLCTGPRRLLCTGSNAGRLPSGVRTDSDFHGLSCGRGLLDGIR